MKTYQDCIEMVTKRYVMPKTLNEYGRYILMEKAAELYGRYMRFVGYYQGKQAGYLEKTIAIGGNLNWPDEPIESETLANGTLRWRLPQEQQRKEPQTDLPDDLFLLTL